MMSGAVVRTYKKAMKHFRASKPPAILYRAREPDRQSATHQRRTRSSLVKPKKSYDCVAEVEKAQEPIQRMLESMTREEQIEFWRVQTEELRNRQKRAQQELAKG